MSVWQWIALVIGLLSVAVTVLLFVYSLCKISAQADEQLERMERER